MLKDRGCCATLHERMHRRTMGMTNQHSRRAFFATGSAAALTGLSSSKASAMSTPQTLNDLTPAQDAAKPNDAAITTDTIKEAEKLAGITYTNEEREAIARSIGQQAAGFQLRQQHELPNSLSPAMVFDPRLPGEEYAIESQFKRSPAADVPLPDNDEDIAFAPVTQLARWIASQALTSERLTNIYLNRLKTFDPSLECIITLTADRALQQARQADLEIAAGNYRGPLHGIPWGAKDLFDTAGIKTTYGAMPFKNRVATEDAAVVKLLDDAGAVMVAKLTLGALAYGDIWFDGRTNNPWNIKQGSSGSSAGSASATAAGLVGFALGTETLGSIVSPSMRCGTTGLRPTFGRVPRSGVMALCWSLDKVGPICRTVEDAALVLNVINGFDAGDASSIDMPFAFDATKNIAGLKAGYVPAWFERGANHLDRNMLELAEKIGLELLTIELPDLPYGSLMNILSTEAAAAFEELTLSNRDDELKWQAANAWPNTFRQARFIPAIEVIQANRIRREVMLAMHEAFADVDVMIGPSYAGSMLLITNNTGHPSLTIRSGFYDNGSPHGFTIWGRLFDEGTICNVGMAFERELSVWDQRPTLSE